jgi:carbon-monoxide dehydrogenase medium subunit
MYSVNYHRASSLDEAVALLGETGEGKLIAGGQTLLPTMKARLAAPSDLVDLRHVRDLKGVTVSGNSVTIGAGTTHEEVASDNALAEVCPGISELAGQIGDPQVRHMGTIGGSIANNDPAADYPAAMLALKATITTNKREIAADDFFRGLFETALEDDEIVTKVSFPAPAQCGYEKFRNPASRYALTGVFVAKDAGGVRVAVTGAGDDGVFRASEIEQALSGNFNPAALDGVSVPSANLMSDIHASAEYRANLIVVLARRATAKALG